MAKTKRAEQSKITPNTAEPAGRVERFAEFYTRFKDFIGYIGIGILIVLVLVFLMLYNNRMKESQASALLLNAITLYDQAFAFAPADPESEPSVSREKIAQSFEEITDNYPQTDSARTAVLLEASTYLNMGEYQKALEKYNIFMDSNPDHILVPTALLGSATAKFNLGDIQDSHRDLDRIMTGYPDFPLMDIVIFEAARRLESEENWSQAIQYYEKLVKDYPKSDWNNSAEKQLERIRKEHAPDEPLQQAESQP
ncbi:tetratricopeptide repeat protein [bacterium]|nr:tetratricopeptide repeat protein [candidate division CSSED10-310 bacterium]